MEGIENPTQPLCGVSVGPNLAPFDILFDTNKKKHLRVAFMKICENVFPHAGQFLKGYIHSVEVCAEMYMTSAVHAEASLPWNGCPQLKNWNPEQDHMGVWTLYRAAVANTCNTHHLRTLWIPLRNFSHLIYEKQFFHT